MQNAALIATVTVVPIMASIGFSAGIGATDVALKAVAPPPARSLSVGSLDYENGEMRQRIIPDGATAIRAEWSANIRRGDRVLCSGGGTGTYEGRLTIMSPDDWTNDECPPLQSGDTATATWEYTTKENLVVSITGKTIIVE